MVDYKSVFSYSYQNNSEIVFDIHFNTGGMGVGAEYVQYHYPETYARANGIPFAGGTFPDAPKIISEDMFALFEENDPSLEFTIHEGFVDQNGNVSDDTFIKNIPGFGQFGYLPI